MSATTVQWLLVGHLFGVLMWVGTLFGAFHVLAAHAKGNAAEAPAFTDLERALGRAMDIGATIAIAFGVLLIVVPDAGMQVFKGGGYFHAKLTAVVVLLGIHGLLRAKIGKFRRGEGTPPPSFLVPVLSLLVLAILVLIVVKPF